MNYPNLFSPIKLGNVMLKNRLVMSPMNTAFFHDDGTLSDQAYAYYLERARGGVGLIILEACAVDWPLHKGGKRQPKFNSQTIIPDWWRLTDSVHALGSKIIAQINHNGFKANPKNNQGHYSVTASEDTILSENFPAKALTTEEVKEYVNKYANVASVIKSCGFDGIEIHAAHGYLINEFLSPLTNFRTDCYGGSLENRTRFLLEIIEAVRMATGPNFIISVRFPMSDECEKGLDFNETTQMIVLCEQAGADMINCSVGFDPLGAMAEGEFSPEGNRLAYAEQASSVVRTAKVSIVGKLRSPDMCEEILASHKADLICMGRTLICDPQWPYKVQFNRADEIRPCLSCSEGCLNRFLAGSGLRCAINPYVGYEQLHSESAAYISAQGKRVVIVGGGLSGMQAAIIAKRGGHTPIILEKEAELGGQMNLACIPPDKDKIRQAKEWFIAELRRLNVQTICSTAASAEVILDQKPDVVLNATGSLPWKAPIPGNENAQNVWDVLSIKENRPIGKNIIIIGGGTVGCETADLLLDYQNTVAIFETTNVLCSGLENGHKAHLLEKLKQNHVRFHVGTTIRAIQENGIEYQASNGTIEHLDCDLILMATGQRPVIQDWEDTLKNNKIPVYTIGDALQIGNFRNACRTAWEVMFSI